MIDHGSNAGAAYVFLKQTDHWYWINKLPMGSTRQQMIKRDPKTSLPVPTLSAVLNTPQQTDYSHRLGGWQGQNQPG